MFKKYLDILQFKSYDKRKERVSEENRSGISLILLFYSVILILNIIGEAVGHRNIFQNRSLVLEIVYMVSAVPLYFIVLRKKDLNFTLMIYLYEIPLLLITILHGTFWDPNSLTFTFLLFLLILPLLILDKPWRVILLIVSLTAVFVVTDLLSKEPALISKDLMHAFNACLMSIAATLYTLTVRIENIEYAGYFEEKADRDSLTGLYNRFGAKRHIMENQPGILVYMDLDHFKEVNDGFGHGEGDHVLQLTAEILRTCFRKDDILIRMGGDEFAVFAPGKWTQDEIVEKMREVLSKVESIHSYGHKNEIAMTVSIGCVYTPDGMTDPEYLIRKADEEMYEIKRNGKDNFGIVTIKKADS